MKKFLKILSLFIAVFFILGMADQLFGFDWPKLFLPASVFGFAFIWMPVFLFYAYDRRQRKKEALEDLEE